MVHKGGTRNLATRAGASDRGAKMAKNAILVGNFAKFPPTRTQHFSPTGS